MSLRIARKMNSAAAKVGTAALLAACTLAKKAEPDGVRSRRLRNE
jgi:hypothetical protein